MPLFLHAADIHLDSPLRGLERYEGAPVNEIREATRRAFENLVDLAIEREVAFVVLAGDLYDGDWKDYRTGLFFTTQMSRLRQSGISTYVLAGNHDAQSQLTKHLKPPDNVHVFSTEAPQTFVSEAAGVALHGQGYPTRAVTEDLSVAYPAPVRGLLNIGVLHTSVDGREDHEPYAPCSLAGLRTHGYQYWALGHVHVREVLSTDPWVVFPGNLQGRHARETGPKGATLVSYKGDEIQSVEAIPLDVLRWVVIEIDAAEAQRPDAVVDLVRGALERARDEADGRLLAARVVVQGATKAHAALVREAERWTSQIRAAATDLGDVWIERVRLRTHTVLDLGRLRERDDAVGALVRALDGLDQDPAAAVAYGTELDDLRQKLPGHLVVAPEVPPAGDAVALRHALEDAKEILLSRLVEGNDA